MKKIVLLAISLCLMASSWSQNQPAAFDSTFRTLYKAAALHPGYMNRNGTINDSIVRRWDKNITIYIKGGSGKDRREIRAKLKNTIALISPSLNNKISISFADEMRSANYLIDLDFRGRSGWYLKWDALGNIYNCIVSLNTKEVFNYDQEASLVSHYFYQTLGDFVFSRKDRAGLLKNDRSIASNVSVWRQDINDIDLRILKVHYSDEIKPGMAEKDVDQFFDKHN